MKNDQLPLKRQADHEFSRILNLEELQAGRDYHIKINAEPEELKKLPKRLKIPSIKRLSAECRFHFWGANETLKVEITIQARITQQCGVSLQNFDEIIEAKSVYEGLAESILMKRQQPSEDYNPDELDIEPIVEGKVDLGDLVVQYLSLEINPYPRKPGATFELGKEPLEAEKGERHRPFENLSQLLKKGSE